jgi:hypothetical protein
MQTRARKGRAARRESKVIAMVGRTRSMALAALLIATALAGACQASSASSSPTSSSTNKSSASASPSPTSETSPTPLPAGITLKKIADKRWGDPTFKASAKGSDGKPVKYSASGGCKINASNGTVTIQSVGSCKITAKSATLGKAATVSTTFSIEKARPVIKFGKRETRFKRNLNYALKATSSPSIPLKYVVVHGAAGTSNDEFCTTKGGALVWTKPPTIDDHPGMDAFCMVRVSAATTSKNYTSPKAVQALVHIDYPAWAVHADTQKVSLADAIVRDGSRYARVKVFEDNASALGMDVGTLSGDCGGGRVVSSTRTTYTIEVFVLRAGDCTLHASAEPQDYHQGNKGIGDVEFTLIVTP